MLENPEEAHTAWIRRAASRAVAYLHAPRPVSQGWEASTDASAGWTPCEDWGRRTMRSTSCLACHGLALDCSLCAFYPGFLLPPPSSNFDNLLEALSFASMSAEKHDAAEIYGVRKRARNACDACRARKVRVMHILVWARPRCLTRTSDSVTTTKTPILVGNA